MLDTHKLLSVISSNTNFKLLRTKLIVTSRKRSLRRLCFTRVCLSKGRGREYLSRYPPGPGTPPRTQYTPLGPGTPRRVPPGTRYTPWQVPPGTRYTPQDQIHPRQVPPRTRYTPVAGTPLTRYPQDQVYPPGSSACWEILATSGRYASYWNAFLFNFIIWCRVSSAVVFFSGG